MLNTLISVTITSGTSASVTVKTATIVGVTVWVKGVLITNPTSSVATLRLRKGTTDIFILRCPANDCRFFPVPFRVDLEVNESLNLVVEGSTTGVYGAVIVGA